MTVNTYKQLHPSLQLLIFISLTLTGIFIGYLIGAGLIIAFYGVNVLTSVARLDLSTPNAADALWVLQIISTTLPIFASALIFARFIVKDPREYLKTTFKFSPVLLAIIFCIMLFSSPLIELLSNINQQLALPQFLSGLQQWMRDSEDKAQKLTVVLLQMKTFWSMVIKVLVVGLLTAVVEEFMFRGCLQTLFTRWTKNTHAAIWITAILFSAFHMEFFGFLPRMMLGVLFGYLVAWSGSIWTSVWAHFINNGTAVVQSYLFQNKMIKLNPDDPHVFNYGSYAFSLIIILFLLLLYKNIATGKKLLPEY
jgi:membrane protease YdiL (CAAX protease family)